MNESCKSLHLLNFPMSDIQYLVDVSYSHHCVFLPVECSQRDTHTKNSYNSESNINFGFFFVESLRARISAHFGKSITKSISHWFRAKWLLVASVSKTSIQKYLFVHALRSDEIVCESCAGAEWTGNLLTWCQIAVLCIEFVPIRFVIRL